MTTKRYWLWWEDTCWVCTGGGATKPHLHVSSKGPDLRSPCATTPVVVYAESRQQAIRTYREQLLQAERQITRAARQQRILSGESV
jgi:hypothetical protein